MISNLKTWFLGTVAALIGLLWGAFKYQKGMREKEKTDAQEHAQEVREEAVQAILKGEAEKREILSEKPRPDMHHFTD